MKRLSLRPEVLAPLAGALLVGLSAAGAGYFSAGSSATPATSVAKAEAPVSGFRGVIQSVSGDSVTLATDAGSRNVRLTPATAIEALRPASLASIRPGDWINAGAVRNRQTIFALTGVVVLPQGSFERPSR